MFLHQMGTGDCVGLALQVCAALGNTPQEKLPEQSSGLAEGLVVHVHLHIGL